MSLFWKRKQHIAQEHALDDAVSLEVEKIKKPLHEVSKSATKSIKGVESTLRANGITLQIHVATGGRHGK